MGWITQLMADIAPGLLIALILWLVSHVYRRALEWWRRRNRGLNVGGPYFG